MLRYIQPLIKIFLWTTERIKQNLFVSLSVLLIIYLTVSVLSHFGFLLKHLEKTTEENLYNEAMLCGKGMEKHFEVFDVRVHSVLYQCLLMDSLTFGNKLEHELNLINEHFGGLIQSANFRHAISGESYVYQNKKLKKKAIEGMHIIEPLFCSSDTVIYTKDRVTVKRSLCLQGKVLISADIYLNLSDFFNKEFEEADISTNNWTMILNENGENIFLKSYEMELQHKSVNYSDNSFLSSLFSPNITNYNVSVEGKKVSTLTASYPFKLLGEEFSVIFSVEKKQLMQDLHKHKFWILFHILLINAIMFLVFIRILLRLREINQLRRKRESYFQSQEQRLSNIIEGTNIGTWEWNVDTSQFICNKQYASILGYAAGEVIGVTYKFWQSNIHPDDLGKCMSGLRKHFQGFHSHYSMEYRMKHTAGYWVWVHDRGKVISKSSDGEPIWMFGTLQDITERKLAEISLLENEIKLKEAQRLAKIGYFSLDLVTMYWTSSEELDKIFGIDSSFPRILDSWTNLFQADFKTTMLEYFTKSKFETNEKFDEVFEIRTFYNSEKKWVHIRGNLSLNSDNIPQKMFGTIQDVTEQKENEIAVFQLNEELSAKSEALKRSNDELTVAIELAESANSLKSQFLANMSHEIRTPLNSIIGFADVLTDCLDDSEHSKYAQNIQIGGKTLLRLINEILDLSKIEAGQMTVVKEPVNIRVVSNELYELFRVKAVGKGLVFQIIIQPELPDLIKTDDLKLRQIVTNLIGNALKFTEKGEVIVTINYKYISSQFLDLEIEVRDTGIGIPQDKLEIIFSPFLQQDNSTTKKYGGTGLGLSISRSLARLLGGDVSVKSSVGEGACFTLKISSLEFIAKSTALRRDSIKLDLVLPKCTILIVDDVDVNRQVLCNFMNDHPVDIMEASGGIEAINLCTNCKPDLAVMDLMMPVIDGYQTTEALKEMYPELPVIAITAGIASSKHSEKNKKYFVDFLQKPLSKTKFISSVYEVLRHIEGKQLDNACNDSMLMFQIKDIVLSDELYAELQDTISSSLSSAVQSGNLDETISFSKELQELSNKYECECFMKLGEMLFEAANSFDVMQMDYVFNSTKKLIENILNQTKI